MLQVSAHPGLSCVDLLREVRAGRVPAAANLAAWLASDRPAWVVLWCLQNFAQEGRPARDLVRVVQELCRELRR